MNDVTTEAEGGRVAVVRIHRAPDNYFDTSLLDELATAYEELAGTRWCRAIVLASEGKHFCAGLDFAKGGEPDIAELYHHALRLFASPLPVVAAVQGAAIGGGLGLALSADFRICAAESRFSANFSRLGFHHGFALSVTLPRAVGHQAAADLLYTGRRIGGSEALALGLCDALVDQSELLGGATSYAASIAASGPLAVRSIRATLRQGLVERAQVAMEQECAIQERLRGTRDFVEGVTANRERREPDFMGE